jgi:hypothetical protein
VVLVCAALTASADSATVKGQYFFQDAGPANGSAAVTLQIRLLPTVRSLDQERRLSIRSPIDDSSIVATSAPIHLVGNQAVDLTWRVEVPPEDLRVWKAGATLRLEITAPDLGIAEPIELRYGRFAVSPLAVWLHDPSEPAPVPARAGD